MMRLTRKIATRVVFVFVAAVAASRAFADEALAFVEVEDTATVPFIPTEAEQSVPERFRLVEHRFDSDAEFLRESGSLRVHRVMFPSPVETAIEENNTVHAEYFQPAGSGPFPGVAVRRASRFSSCWSRSIR